MTRRNELRAKLGITLPESALFLAIHYGCNQPPDRLPRRAECEFDDPSGPTTEECRLALEDCLSKGWLQIIDESVRSSIGDALQKGQMLGPIYGGLPEVGFVDFTETGAELWYKLCDRKASEKDNFPYMDCVCEKSFHYFRTYEAATSFMRESQGEEDVTRVVGPLKIGPWRAQWWRRFADGYRVELEKRRQWQGYWGGENERYYLDYTKRSLDQDRLTHILDSKNVTFAEWLIMESLEDGYCRDSAENHCRHAGEKGRKLFNTSISEEQCREAFEACMQNGWLSITDQSAIEEVQTLIRNDSAILALPHTASFYSPECAYSFADFAPVPSPDQLRCGDIDFTPVGAMLYRTIMGEWLGMDWENDLYVSKVFYWEEHIYCEVDSGFDYIIQEHQARGTRVMASRVVPIGPWCVAWWRQFPNGFRLELELMSAEPHQNQQPAFPNG